MAAALNVTIDQSAINVHQLEADLRKVARFTGTTAELGNWLSERALKALGAQIGTRNGHLGFIFTARSLRVGARNVHGFLQEDGRQLICVFADGSPTPPSAVVVVFTAVSTKDVEVTDMPYTYTTAV